MVRYMDWPQKAANLQRKPLKTIRKPGERLLKNRARKSDSLETKQRNNGSGLLHSTLQV